MLATISSATLLGVDGHAVTVEVHIAQGGLPSFTIVGLPDASCREARDRVRAAIECSGLPWPMRRITVNLAPTNLRKVGSSLDLAIALGVLEASEQIPAGTFVDCGVIGELGLDGSLRAVPGGVSLVGALGTHRVLVPHKLRAEAEVLGRHDVRSAATLGEMVAAVLRTQPWPDPPPPPLALPERPEPDLADVSGHPVARLAVEVAAAGAHHLLLIGPPGSGKTMLATRLVSVLPDLGTDEALEVTRVHSAAGLPLPPSGLVRRPPLRAPHHGTSAVALVGGGGTTLRPGEVSLAHRGVLFLDEMGEFPTVALDGLRTPLEEGVVRVARAQVKATLPARVLLVGAMNPCPCGASGGPGSCRCSDASIQRYARRLSGPLLDRFDLRIDVGPPDPDSLMAPSRGECSASVAVRVVAARRRAEQRGVVVNAALNGAELDRCAPLTKDGTAYLVDELRAGRLSARGMRRVRTVALTLADLAEREPPLDAADLRLAMALRIDPRLAVSTPMMGGAA